MTAPTIEERADEILAEIHIDGRTSPHRLAEIRAHVIATIAAACDDAVAAQRDADLDYDSNWT